jgi:putative alpha-1,2-mannosidase
MSLSIWDLFRSQLPFLTITDPEAVAQMVRSLIDTYQHLGWLPDCRMSLNKGYTQVTRHHYHNLQLQR